MTIEYLNCIIQSPFFPLIQLALQGITGGLVVLFFSRLLDWLKRRREMKRILLLLVFEIERHLAIMSTLLAVNRYPDKESTVELSSKTWGHFQSDLVMLDMNLLRALATYYSITQTLNDTMQTKRGCPLNEMEVKSIAASIKTAQSLDSRISKYIEQLSWF